MKKSILFSGALFISAILFGQIKVIENNNVGIHTDNPLSKLGIGSNGSALDYVSIKNQLSAQNSCGLNVLTKLSIRTRYAIRAITESGGAYGTAYGLVGISTNTSGTRNGIACGLYGASDYGTSGRNYAIYGNMMSSQNGTAILGTVGWNPVLLTDKYAGYFVGPVYIKGNTWIIGTLVQTSDIRAKKDIKHLETGNASKLKALNGLKYKLKSPNERKSEAVSMHAAMRTSVVSHDSVSTSSMVKVSPEMQKMYNKERIGLSAQEVQQVYPELVVEAKDGTLGVDYIGLIPILIEAIKEQQEVLEKQQVEIDALKFRNKGRR